MLLLCCSRGWPLRATVYRDALGVCPDSCTVSSGLSFVSFMGFSEGFEVEANLCDPRYCGVVYT